MYTEDYSQLRIAIRDGLNYALPHRLTYYASNFASVTPLSEAVALGFYDPPDTDINTVTIPHSSLQQWHVLAHEISLSLR